MPISGKFIDQDMNSVDVNTAYSLTELCLYKCTDLQNNPPATWAIVLASTTYPELTDVKFSRVRARGNYVYVMGVVNISAVDADIVVFYSTDAGVTWNYSLAATHAAVTFKPYTVTKESALSVANTRLDVPHVRVGDATATFNPICVAMQWWWQGIYGAWRYYWEVTANTINEQGYASGIGYHGDDMLFAHDELRGDGGVLATAVLDDYFGVGWGSFFAGWANMPIDVARSYISMSSTAGTVFQADTWVFWDKPSIVAPTAFDIGKHNPFIVYVGSNDTIYKSIDGGAHFVEHITSDGAMDIECHLAQSASDAEITFWSATTGELIRTVGGVVTGVYGGVLDVVPIDIPFRIASDPVNGFPIWVLEHQGSYVYKLRKSNDGAVWTDITVDGSTSLSGARSLKEYAVAVTLERRIVLLKTSGIWYSTDEGTFTNKKGAYGGFYYPAVVNLW